MANDTKKIWSFTAGKPEISGALGRVLGAVDKRTTIDILNYVKVDVLLRGAVAISATDLEVHATAECRAEVPAAGGTICAPAELIKGAIAGLSGNITFTLTADNRLVIEANERRFELACLPADEFPESPMHWKPIVGHFEPGALPRMLRSVSHAICQDETKYNLCGVYLCPDRGRLTAVATDGHRLSIAGAEIPGVELESGVLIPAKAVRILSGIQGSISIALGTPGKNDNQIYFDAENLELAVRLIDGQYPDFRRVIPKDHTDHFTADLSLLADAVEAVAVVSDGKSRSVDLEAPEENLGEALTVSALGTAGVASATVSCMGGVGYHTAANARYLLQALRALDGEGFIKYGGSSPSIFMVPVDHSGFDERIEVVMPYKV